MFDHFKAVLGEETFNKWMEEAADVFIYEENSKYKRDKENNKGDEDMKNTIYLITYLDDENKITKAYVVEINMDYAIEKIKSETSSLSERILSIKAVGSEETDSSGIYKALD